MKKKFGKSIGNLLYIKKDFFSKNDILLNDKKRIADYYKLQPIRTHCKLCGDKLSNCKEFTSHDLKYYFCNNCNHLNGEFEDTVSFAEKIYVEDDYGKEYTEDEYQKYVTRVDEIYYPKLKFLLESLREHEENKKIDILDLGAGSGYFVSAGKKHNINISGIEISKKQVDYANLMNGEKIIEQVNQENISNILKTTNKNIISAIGVLEHITNLAEILENIKSNENIEFFYISVPLFSLSCIVEASFPNCFNRHLGGAHTHLFTMESLEWMSKFYGLHVVSSWQFGADIMDLFRALCVNLNNNKNENFINDFKEKFIPVIDDLQLIIDKANFSSEIHMLFQKNREYTEEN